MADPRSNALILRAANPARVQLVRTLVDKLDRQVVRHKDRLQDHHHEAPKRVM